MLLRMFYGGSKDALHKQWDISKDDVDWLVAKLGPAIAPPTFVQCLYRWEVWFQGHLLIIRIDKDTNTP